MRRFLFILFNGSGRILPAFGVIRALLEAGHEVGLVTVPGEFRGGTLLQRLVELGAAIFASPAHPEECHPGAIYPGTVAEEVSMRFLLAPESTLEFRRQRQMGPVLSQIDPLRSILSTYRPDVVVADTLAYQAGIAAHLEALPFIGYTASLRMVAPASVRFDMESEALLPEVTALFERFGMSPRFASLEYLSPLVNLVFALPEFVGHDVPNADLVRLVGPPSMAARGDEVGFEWDKLATDRPRVFISCGTVLRWQPELLDLISEALLPLGAQGIVSAGELASEKKFGDHILAASYVPQLELLQHVDVFVTVGGANSMNEALCAGVPMLVLPIISDQFLQAHFVEASRVGLAIAPAERTVQSVRAALVRLLDPAEGYRERCRKTQKAYLEVDGASRAAQELVAASTSRADR